MVSDISSRKLSKIKVKLTTFENVFLHVSMKAVIYTSFLKLLTKSIPIMKSKKKKTTHSQIVLACATKMTCLVLTKTSSLIYLRNTLLKLQVSV